MVATRLKYNLTAGTHYIDLNRDLSEFLRKLHRQKVVTTVYGGFMRNNASTSAKISVAPLTWQSKSAVNRAFGKWRKMVSETLKNHDGARSGKWNDFKIYLDNQMGTPTPAQDAAGNVMSTGEWDYSTMTQPQLIDPDGDGGLEFDGNADQWEMMIIGPHAGAAPNYTRVGVITSWTDSRPVATPSTGTPNYRDPTTLADPLSNLFNVEDDDSEKMTVIESEGDFPPYNRLTPYGMTAGALAPVSIADNGASPSITPVGNNIHGFQALCGLVQIVVAGEGTTEIFLDVESKGESF